VHEPPAARGANSVPAGTGPDQGHGRADETRDSGTPVIPRPADPQNVRFPLSQLRQNVIPGVRRFSGASDLCILRQRENLEGMIRQIPAVCEM